jgi:flagellar protein FlaF
MKNPYSKQVQSYERVPEPGNPRQTEAWAMAQAATRLALAITHGDDGDAETKDVRRDALRLNWRLWTIIQSELAQDRPDLPRELHLNMLQLCNFIDKHTVGALVNPTAEALRVLIDINRNVAAGLISQSTDGQPQDGTPTEPGPAAKMRAEA